MSYGIMDENQFNALVIQLTDRLFDKGHTINKPLVLEAAEFAKMYAESWFAQGEAKAKFDQQQKEAKL